MCRTRSLARGNCSRDGDFRQKSLDAVAEAIRTHQPADEPQSTEAILLRDADILEQLGAVGALRALAKVGRDTRYATFFSVVQMLREAVNRLPALLRIEASRQLALPKVAALNAFLDAVEAEAGENLY